MYRLALGSISWFSLPTHLPPCPSAAASATPPCCAGSAFGKGIYFSSELAVAYAFCQPAEGWAGSALGRRLRGLLVCSIERDAIQSSHNSDLVSGQLGPFAARQSTCTFVLPVWVSSVARVWSVVQVGGSK